MERTARSRIPATVERKSGAAVGSSAVLGIMFMSLTKSLSLWSQGLPPAPEASDAAGSRQYPRIAWDSPDPSAIVGYGGA